MIHWDQIAALGYEAYCKASGGHFHGEPMVPWEDLPEAMQEAWLVAAEKIVVAHDRALLGGGSDLADRSEGFLHVDDFIDNYKSPAYPRFVLHFMRLKAALHLDFWPLIKQYRLFCDHDGNRYRVTFASRMGDIGLHSNFDKETGYDHRVPIDECSNWGPEP
jgi:hypothetical protein